MINSIVKSLFNKELVLYHKHRQTLPIVNLKDNKKKFYFFDPSFLWKASAILGKKSLLRFRFQSFILSLLQPKYILSMNWISKLDTLYYVWCKRKNSSKFIVVQHGSYFGGIITDIHHRQAKCQIVLCWSSYFKNTFEGYIYNNKGTRFIVNGNPIYNEHDRNDFEYKSILGNKILFAPSCISPERALIYKRIIVFLKKFDFEIVLKEHALQNKFFNELQFDLPKSYDALSDILKNQLFDIVITDKSTALLDTVFFKNNLIFFSPKDEVKEYSENIYSNFLTNLADLEFENLTKKQFLDYISIDNQENLFSYLVEKGTNQIIDL